METGRGKKVAYEELGGVSEGRLAMGFKGGCRLVMVMHSKVPPWETDWETKR